MNAELTFEQQQHISEILENFRNNPSNSNKFRYELFAYIDGLLAKPEISADQLLNSLTDRPEHDRAYTLGELESALETLKNREEKR